MSIDQRFIDPNTGRIKPLAEYAPEIANAPWGGGSGTLSPETRPTWFKDGKIKTTAEIRDDEAREKLAADTVAAQVRARTEKTLTDDERLIRSLDSMIAERSREARYLSRPADKANALEYLDHLKARKVEVESKISEAKRVAALSDSRLVQLARAYAETYSRSPPLGVTPEQAALIVALANRTDADPETLAKEFWAEVATTEATALQVATTTALDKQELALRHGLEHALSEVAVAESRKRLHEAQQQANPDEQN